MITKPCSSMKAWSLNMRTETDVIYMPAVFNFVLKMFEDTFGATLMSPTGALRTNTHFDVENGPDDWLEPLIDNYTVRTSALNKRDWAGYIFQLSYGLTQHLLQNAHLGPRSKVQWFEHNMCYAVALYMLDTAADNWSDCVLSTEIPDYGIDLNRRYNDLMFDAPVHAPSIIKAMPKLCQLFTDMSYDVRAIAQYTAFTSLDNDEIDFEKWFDSNDYKFPDKYRSGDHKVFIKRLGDILYPNNKNFLDINDNGIDDDEEFDLDDELEADRAYWEGLYQDNDD